jgi:hypothetical protein
MYFLFLNLNNRPKYAPSSDNEEQESSESEEQEEDVQAKSRPQVPDHELLKQMSGKHKLLENY